MTLPAECEAALAELDALRRGTLPASEVASMQRHLDACLHCSTYKLHEEAFLDRLAGAARKHSCPEQLRATISQLLAKEARDT